MGILSDAFRVQNSPTQLVRDVLIETGTSVGDSFAFALTQPYKELYTIEWNAEAHHKALARFQHVLDFKCPCPCGFSRTARLCHGSSPEMLPRMMDGEKDTVFFLDAHWVGGETDDYDRRYPQSVLLLELEAIARVQWKKRPLVICDDAAMRFSNFWTRLGVNERWEKSQWPTVDDIMQLMGPQGYSLTVLNDQLWLW